MQIQRENIYKKNYRYGHFVMGFR